MKTIIGICLFILSFTTISFAQQDSIKTCPCDSSRLVNLMRNSGGSTPYHLDFNDFIFFVSAFNARKGDPKYKESADLNCDGVVNFPDFICIASFFNRVKKPQTNIPTTKPVLPYPIK